MDYIVGMDGGGTKTRCVVASKQNSVVFRTNGGGTNFLIQNIETTCENILSIIAECCGSLGISYSDLDKILIGTAGAGRKDDAEKLKNAFNDFCAGKNIRLNSFEVTGDAEIALEGAFPDLPGCILIAGTGSVIFGKDSAGKIYRSGGFGRIIGDEGGGYSIGRKALQAVSKSMDGRSGPTSLTDLIKEFFNISSQGELITAVYGKKLDVPSAAPLVIRAAAEGDEAAFNIIDGETDELVSLVSSLIQKMKMNKIGLSLLGSLIDKDNFYSRLLKEKISKKFEGIELKDPEYPPEMGAVFLAQKNKDGLNH